MAVATIEAQLEETQAAITAVMSGQSFTLDGVTYTRASLSALHAREEYLQRQYNKVAASSSRPFLKTVNFGGMSY